MQKIYNFFSGLFPFKNATELTYWRVKSIGAAVGASMIAIFFVFELLIFGSVAKQMDLIKSFSSKQNAKIALVEISGEITTKTADDFISKFEELRADDSYKSIIIKMNSGGGSPAGSDDIANYLVDFQKDKKVYVYVQSIAASGAYYITSAIKPINANPNAIVGSIGVILPHYNAGKVAEKIGVEEDNLVAGMYKAPISLFKKLNDADKDYLTEHLMHPTYGNFKNFVAKSRGISADKIEEYAQGKIYIASMPEIQGVLVDNVTSYTAVEKLAKLEAANSTKGLTPKDIIVEPVKISKEKTGGIFGIDFNIKGLEFMSNSKLSSSVELK